MKTVHIQLTDKGGYVGMLEVLTGGALATQRHPGFSGQWLRLTLGL